MRETRPDDTENGPHAQRSKLTKRFVEGVRFEDLVKLGSKQRHAIVFDDELPGFGLRLMRSGVRSYLVLYRNKNGRQRPLTIGKHGKITAEAARERAMRILGVVRDGNDPIGRREALLRAPTINDMLDRYIAEHVEHKNRESTQIAVKQIVERIIRPAIGAEKVGAITSKDMAALHRANAS